MPLVTSAGFKKTSRIARSFASRSVTSVTGPSLITNGLVFHVDPSDPACYPGSGTTCTDLTGLNGSAPLSNVFFTGGTDKAFQFSSSGGSSANGNITFNRGYTNVSNSHTFQALAFVPYTVPGSYPAILSSVNSTTGGIAMYPYQDDPVDFAVGAFIQDDPADFFDDINGVVYNSTAPKTVVITVTISAVNLSVYGNGVEVATNGNANTPRGGGVINAQSQIQLGAAVVALFPTWVGLKLYHAAIYNRPLSAEEVLQNYNYLKSRYSGLGLP